ncbi:MAG: hypothetical protein COX49_00750 [bacterium (Candidatus Stahlbacteria) CG23_combo_of_CG06-09_8_20_14_all_40_9]|nr:MAG: hypothetical protein COX49_00750 [bacterium (Candidatus Stahlbacteria) CG23_combo_of_CG06-09_8_20_14_all_40_9]
MVGSRTKRKYLETKPQIIHAEIQSILWERSPDLDDLQEMLPTIIKICEIPACGRQEWLKEVMQDYIYKKQ